MPDLLTGVPFVDVGASALVVLVVLMVLTGRLVTRQQLLDAQADRDKWRTSAEKWQEGALKLGMAMEKVVVLAEATNHALGEIQAFATRRAEPPQ